MATKRRITQPATDAKAFLQKLNEGPLSFGQAIGAVRLCEEASLSAFASRLGVSRAYLCDVEKGRRSVSARRAADWARKLGHSQAQFVGLALQDEVNAAGLKLKVDVQAA